MHVDTAIDPIIMGALTALDGRAPQLAGMVRYHLGYLNADLSPASPETIAASRGKRLRPELALQVCAAAGGSVATAAPLAAAVELLHNFTLIHDDIQDRSEFRRHRPTVWSLWGVAQAINAGDALFAAAHLPIVRLGELDVPAETTVQIIEAFNRMTIEIVEGQVLELSFEGRDDVTPDDYLDMIAGKTAAIVRFAAWAGALLAGRSEAEADRFGAFGRSLGLGFQIRDDALGVWGEPATTGKSAADDIRQRKQSLPILILRQRVSLLERRELDRIYGSEEIDERGIDRILTLLAAHDVEREVTLRTNKVHGEAQAALSLAPTVDHAARQRLLEMIDMMATRSF